MEVDEKIYDAINCLNVNWLEKIKAEILANTREYKCNGDDELIFLIQLFSNISYIIKKKVLRKE